MYPQFVDLHMLLTPDLKKYFPLKKYSQNFLINQKLIEEIVNFINPKI